MMSNNRKENRAVMINVCENSYCTYFFCVFLTHMEARNNGNDDKGPFPNYREHVFLYSSEHLN